MLQDESDEDMEDTAALLAKKRPLGDKNSSPSKGRRSDAKPDVWGFDESQEDSQDVEEVDEEDGGAAAVPAPEPARPPPAAPP